MTVTTISHAFIGGSIRRDELKATEIQIGVEQGPIPPHLLIELEEEEEPIWKPRPRKRNGSTFGCLSEEERREKSRIGAAKRHAKARAYAAPCPKCDGSTRLKNRPNGPPRRWCEHCKTTFRMEGETLVPVKSRHVPGGPPCAHCGKETASSGLLYWRCKGCKRRLRKGGPVQRNHYPCPKCKGRTRTRGSASGGGAWRRCRTCGHDFRTLPLPPKPTYPACPHCGGQSRRNGKEPDGRQILQCKECRQTFRVDSVADAIHLTQDHRNEERHEQLRMV